MIKKTKFNLIYSVINKNIVFTTCIYDVNHHKITNGVLQKFSKIMRDLARLDIIGILCRWLKSPQNAKWCNKKISKSMKNLASLDIMNVFFFFGAYHLS